VTVVAATEAAIGKTLAAARQRTFWTRRPAVAGAVASQQWRWFPSQRGRDLPPSKYASARRRISWRRSRPDRVVIAAGRWRLFATRVAMIIVAPAVTSIIAGCSHAVCTSAQNDSTKNRFVLPGESLAKYRGLSGAGTHRRCSRCRARTLRTTKKWNRMSRSHAFRPARLLRMRRRRSRGGLPVASGWRFHEIRQNLNYDS